MSYTETSERQVEVEKRRDKETSADEKERGGGEIKRKEKGGKGEDGKKREKRRRLTNNLPNSVIPARSTCDNFLPVCRKSD